MRAPQQPGALVIEAMISPGDVDGLDLHQWVRVRLSTARERALPILMGTITKLAAHSHLDRRTGQRFFRAEISIPPEELAKIARATDGGEQAALSAELIGPARRRTALGTLLTPLTPIIWNPNRKH